MASRLVEIGRLSFKHRGVLLPIAVLLLFIPSPPIASDPAAIGLAGVAVALFGQAIRIGTIGLAYIIRGGKDYGVYAEDLVTTGIYSHTRNPMYLGNFFLLLGLALASNSWVFLIAGMTIALAMHWAIIAAEEDFLRGKFGAKFDAFCARTPRLVPRLTGLGATFRSMQFDWRRVWLKEYAKPVDWLSATAIVVLVNLWRADALQEHRVAVVLLLAVIVARLVLWASARSQRRPVGEH